VDERPGGPAPEPRQRWRIVFSREAAASSVTAAEEVELWAAAMSESGIPLASGGGRSSRPRLSFAAPTPTGVPCDRELLDIVLTKRLSRAEVRDRLERACPAGHRIVDLFDVWLGEPSITARLGAADYRIVVGGAGPDQISAAAGALLSAGSLPRRRSKGEGRSVEYDLRPLVLDLAAVPDSTPATDRTTIRARLRLAQDGPSGRVEELVLALAEQAGRELTLVSAVRERLLTSDELEDGAQTGPLGHDAPVS
jgi:radical SAM-linked protein